MGHSENVHRACVSVLSRVQQGEPLSLALCRQVVKAQGLDVQPTVVLFEVTGALADLARTERHGLG
jgi:hypothetical protein